MAAHIPVKKLVEVILFKKHWVQVNQRTHFPLTPTYFPPGASKQGGGGGQAVETESMLVLAESGYVDLP
jgi:hypothetical protein